MTIDPDIFGSALAQLRLLRGLTQRDLATKCGVTTNYVSLIENGQRTASIETVNTFAGVLSLPAQCLLFLGAAPPPTGSVFSDVVAATCDSIWAAAHAEDESL